MHSSIEPPYEPTPEEHDGVQESELVSPHAGKQETLRLSVILLLIVVLCSVAAISYRAGASRGDSAVAAMPLSNSALDRGTHGRPDPGASHRTFAEGAYEDRSQGELVNRRWSVSVVGDTGVEYSSDDGYRMGRSDMKLSPEKPLEAGIADRGSKYIVFGAWRVASGREVVVRLENGTVAKPSALAQLRGSESSAFALELDKTSQIVAIELQRADGSTIYTTTPHVRADTIVRR
jgi:hypothetical protein